MNPADRATLTVGSNPPLEIAVDGKKWEAFLAAAEAIGQEPEALLAESIDLCQDTVISVAAHRERE